MLGFLLAAKSVARATIEDKMLQEINQIWLEIRWSWSLFYYLDICNQNSARKLISSCFFFAIFAILNLS